MTDLGYFVHPSSYIDEGAQIGKDTQIWYFCHLMKECRVGENCNIGQNIFIDSGVVIGNRVKVQNNVSIYSGVICEDDVFLGPSMTFTNVINPRAFIERKDEFKITRIKKGASVGANATIVCGNCIGQYAFIGAGTVVTRDVPDYALYYGNPGKIMGWVCKCGQKLEFFNGKALCPVCQLHYVQLDSKEVKLEKE